MPAYRKANIRTLITSTYDLDGNVLQGIVRHTDEGWMVGGMSLEQYLKQHEGHEIALLLFGMDEDSDRPMAKKICRTCGREYTELNCPYCREVLFRLRGR